MDDVLAVLSRTADGVYALNQEQRIIFWNSAAERILGYRAEEVLGRACHDLFEGEPRPGCMECEAHCPVLTAASRHETVPTYNLLSRTKDGDVIMLNISVIVPAADNTSWSTIHLFRDTTHQLRYETYVDQLLCAAARLPKPQATLASPSAFDAAAISAPLSGREKEVLYLLVKGKGARAIADSLYISYATVRNHLQTILRKLGVHSQRDAVRIALERRLV